MKKTDQQAALSALTTLLRPLVRIMIRLNIPFGSFAEVARQVFVQVAAEEFTLDGRKQTNSRIAVLTGLTRKEVLRIQRLPEQDEGALDVRFSRCARVISGWRRDADFSRDGAPLPLSIEDSEPSFRTLVGRYSGDMPVRAVIDELQRVGALETLDNGQVSLLKAAYIPSSDKAEQLAVLGNDIRDLAETVDHNLDAKPELSRFQLKVEYDNLSREAVQLFRELSDRDSLALLKKYDEWLAKHDRDEHPDLPGEGRYRAGVGIFFFEEALLPDNNQEKLP